MTITHQWPTLATRSRIANLPTHEALVRRLLDPAVQQLFAATLDLSTIAASSEPAVSQRLLDVVTALDATMHQLRRDLISHSGSCDFEAPSPSPDVAPALAAAS